MTSEQITELCPKHRAVVPLERAAGHVCPWCMQPTRPRKRKAPKPRRQYQHLTDRQIRAAHVIYETRGLSLRQLGALIYEQHGYSSPQTAASALHKGFKRLGLPLRDRLTAVTRAATKHGQARRGHVTPEYTRARNARRYPRKPCAAVRLNYPRKGEPCKRWATTGSDYCPSHDPAQRARLERHMGDARGWIGL